MIEIRKSEDRGHANHGWLDSRHTFSFASYQDRDHMGFRALRVINEDWVEAGRGFDPHSHRDMEIITYVLEGALQHEDSMGNGSVIRPGDVQLMRAGTGVTHSEYNASRESSVHLLQIWILPDADGLEPAYQQEHFPLESRRGQLRLLASGRDKSASLGIHQDVDLFAAVLEAGESVRHGLAPGRHAWVQVARGRAELNGLPLGSGDGAAVSDETAIELLAQEEAEILVFDLA